jgi:long-subunit fatty acid transport protein
VTLLIAAAALASPMEFYGFGARKMGRAGGGVAVSEGPESILQNPAALPGQLHPQFSLGFVGVDTEFLPIHDVWWDTNRDGSIDATDPPLAMGPDYDAIQGLMVGVTRPIGRYFSFGAGFFLPTDRLLRLQTFEPQLPTYFLYENRAQRYELSVGAGLRPAWGLSVGGGVQVIPRARYRLSATLDMKVEAAESGDDSANDVLAVGLDVHDMELDLVPGFAPMVALHWDAGQAIPALEGLELGASWRGDAGLPVDVDIDLQVNAGTGTIGDLDPTTLPLVLALSLGVFDHYTPSQLNLGAAYTFVETFMMTVDVKRTAWDQMTPSIATVTHLTVEGSGLDVEDGSAKDGNPYDVVLDATWSPRLGAELRLPRFTLWPRWGEWEIDVRGGFGFEPTPLVSQTTATALLDGDRTIFAVGLGFEHDDPFRHEGKQRRARLDGFVQYHIVASGSLDRGVPEEPTAGYSVDGSPVPIGGHLLAAGVQWGLEY